MKGDLVGAARRVRVPVAILALLCIAGACGGSGAGGGTGCGNCSSSSSSVSSAQGILIQPQKPLVAKGQSVQLSAMGRGTDSTSVAITGPVTWASSDTAVATVSATGNVTALADGFAVITAVAAGVTGAVQVVVTESGSLPAGYLYVTSGSVEDGVIQGGAVYQFAIQTDGSLSPLSPAAVPAGEGPTTIVADPSGRYVYVANGGAGTISQYAVGPGGALQGLTPATLSTPLSPPFAWLSVAPAGGVVYLTGSTLPSPAAAPPSSSSGVTGTPVALQAAVLPYAIQADGTLMPLRSVSFTTTGSAAGPLMLDPAGQHGYLARLGGSGAIAQQLAVATDGTLTPVTTAPLALPGSPAAIAITPDGSLAFTLDTCIDTLCDGEVVPFTIGADGALSPAGAASPLGSHVSGQSLLFAAAAPTAYLMTDFFGSDGIRGSLTAYPYDAAGQLCTACGAVALGVPAGFAVAQALYGPALYALFANGEPGIASTPPGGVVSFYADPAGGSAPVSATIALGQPSAMTVVVAH